MALPYIGPPRSPAEWEAYYDLRWRELRAKWGQPRGSEKDAGEEIDLHCCVTLEGVVIAAGRATLADLNAVKIRSMCVEEAHQRQGWGRQILRWLEQELRDKGVKRITLAAREHAVPFYEQAGYNVYAPGELLFGQIPHQLMEKTF